MKKKTENSLIWMGPGRIRALMDGIFAFAMTLLVLNLILPDPTDLPTETQLHSMLLGQMQAFFNYALSFLLLAIFWMIHSQQIHILKKTDFKHIWLNMIILMFVVLVPFSTSVMSDYSEDTLANLAFASNMFIIGVLYYFNWHYAIGKQMLIADEISVERVKLARRRSLLTPLVSILAMVLAFVAPEYTGMSYLLIPILRFTPLFN
jgi:uncharacterized membrane protein